MREGSFPRVRWSVGQILLPEHFRALERSLADEAAARTAMRGLPSYGIASLEWTAEGPERSVLWVKEISVIMPSGELIDVPRNAELRGPADLGSSGLNEISVYLHLLDSQPAESGPAEPAAQTSVPRMVHEVRVSTDEGLNGSRGRIKLGDFTKPFSGPFELAEEYVPPLLTIGATPYFRDRLRSLRGRLTGFDEALSRLAADQLAQHRSIDRALRARHCILELVAMIDDIESGVHLHPYILFAELRSFFLELLLLEGAMPEVDLPRYDHDGLGRCFGELLSTLSYKLEMPPLRSPYIEVELEGDRFVAANLPEDLLNSHEVYLLVQRSRTSVDPPLEKVRLASPSRLRMIHERALRSVRLVRVPQPRFRHAFGRGVLWYQLQTEGGQEREWKHIVEERALCFYSRPELADIRAALFWRRS